MRTVQVNALSVEKDANSVFQPLNVLLVLLTPETMVTELVHARMGKSLVNLQVLSSVVFVIKDVQVAQSNMTIVHLVRLDLPSMMIINVFVLPDSSYQLVNQLAKDVSIIVLSAHLPTIAQTVLKTLSLTSN